MLVSWLDHPEDAGGTLPIHADKLKPFISIGKRQIEVQRKYTTSTRSYDGRVHLNCNCRLKHYYQLLSRLLSSAYNLWVVIDKGKHLLTNIIGEDLLQDDKVHRMQQLYTVFDEGHSHDWGLNCVHMQWFKYNPLSRITGNLMVWICLGSTLFKVLEYCHFWCYKSWQSMHIAFLTLLWRLQELHCCYEYVWNITV